MKGFLVSSISLLLGMAAVPATAALSESEQHLVTACVRMAALAAAVIDDKSQDGVAQDVKNNVYALAARLSEHVPQTYTPIQTGLKEALELKGTESSASLEDRAAVIGLWCVQDTADDIVNSLPHGGEQQSAQPYMLDPETQVKLVDLITETLKGDTQ